MNQNISNSRATLSKEDRKRIMAEEGAILAFTEEMLRRMEELRVSKSELAKRLNVDPAFVSKLIGGENNFTIKTMVKIALTLQSRIELSLAPFKDESSWAMADISKFEFGPIFPISEPANRRIKNTDSWGQYESLVRMDTSPIIPFYETIHAEASLSL